MESTRGDCGSATAAATTATMISTARTRHGYRLALVDVVVTVAVLLLLATAAAPVEALFLPHHQPRRTPTTSSSSSPSRTNTGPSTSATPPLESNTRRSRRQSSAASHSPLVVFYGSLMDRLVSRSSSSSNSNSNNNNNKDPSPQPSDEELFTEDMRQRKDEMIRRYQHHRGRGRWGGYSLQGIQPKQTTTESKAPAALDVVSTETTKEPQQQQQPQPQFSLEHFRGRGRWGGYSFRGISQAKPSPAAAVEPPATNSQRKSKSSKIRTNLSNNRARIRKLAAAKKQKQPKMLQIKDIQHYKKEVVDDKDVSLVVVRFYASWCKACKAIEGSFHRLPSEFPSSVKFVEVPLTKENAYLHKGLGVSSLPFAHIYYNADHPDNNNGGQGKGQGHLHHPVVGNTLVDELKISRNKFSEFRRVLRSYVDRECTVYFSPSEDNDDGEDDGETVVTSSPSRRTNSSRNSNRYGNSKKGESEPEQPAVPI